MSDTNGAVRLAITGAGVVSSIGIGRHTFARGWREGRCGVAAIAGTYQPPLPYERAAQIPDFDPTVWLGRKGTRCLDRTSAFAIVAAGLALKDANLVVGAGNQSRIGMVLGTSFGSLKSISDFSREAMIHERPLLVNPMLFPNTVLNCAAGQAAIWHKLRGVNATVCGGQLSSLMALQYASRAIRLGYADALLAGGVEEFCEQLAWSAFHAGGREMVEVDSDDRLCLGEGCALLVIEPLTAAIARGQLPLAELVGCQSAFCPDLDWRDARACQTEGLLACMKLLLWKEDVEPSVVGAVAMGATGAPNGSVEAAAVRRLFADREVTQLDLKRQIGECYSAAGAFQGAAMLVALADGAGRAPYGFITSAGRDGAVGCALLKYLHDASPEN